MKFVHSLALSTIGLLAACGGSDGPTTLFQPQPECTGDPVVPFAGDHDNVISSIEIGKLDDGFDLDGERDEDCVTMHIAPADCHLPDNKLAAAAFANSSIADSLAKYDILIPLEFFDAGSATADECVKFAIYLGVYKHDADGDGQKTIESDCDDTRMTSAPGAVEDPTDLVDNNCNGMADETDDGQGNITPSTNNVDNDGDLISPMAGDCDDSTATGAMVAPGMPEICGDGLDNDCNGIADDGDLCNPFTTVQTLDIDPLSFDDQGNAQIAFTNGKIDGGVLTAGPSIFSVAIPVLSTTLDLRLTGAQIQANVVADGDTYHLENGRLGGVIDAKTADHIRGLTIDQIGLTPEDSLLDAAFANILGTLLALPTSRQDGFMQCHTPDIDVDGDGLEAFCDSNPTDDNKTVDTCVDGDGTVVHDGDDGVEQCADAVDADGKPRFVDGISVELNFATSPTLLRAP